MAYNRPKAIDDHGQTNYDDFEADRLAPELADVFVLVCALASEHGVDLEQSVRQKFFGSDAERTWKSAAQQ